MLAEEIWQIVEGFVEIPANRWAQFWKASCDIFRNVESANGIFEFVEFTT